MAKKFTQYDEQEIRLVLGTHLKAAAIKEQDAFFGVFTHDATFVGTDDTEQWTRDELIAKLVASPSGWDMTDCRERRIYQAPEKPEVAAFFEVINNTKYGLMRGSGVVIKDDGRWMILHYVLSFSVPNDVVDKTNILDLLAQKS